jgi:hypothetical protein
MISMSKFRAARAVILGRPGMTLSQVASGKFILSEQSLIRGWNARG